MRLLLRVTVAALLGAGMWAVVASAASAAPTPAPQRGGIVGSCATDAAAKQLPAGRPAGQTTVVFQVRPAGATSCSS